jgi:hypothetical protein
MLEVADDTQVASNMRRYMVFPGGGGPEEYLGRGSKSYVKQGYTKEVHMMNREQGCGHKHMATAVWYSSRSFPPQEISRSALACVSATETAAKGFAVSEGLLEPKLCMRHEHERVAKITDLTGRCVSSYVK